MRILALFPFIALAAATPLHPRPHHNVTSPVKCPIIFDGRIPSNLLLSSFDNATSSPFNPDFVKGENRTWSSVLLLPYTRKHSRFDEPHKHKAIEVTIDDGSLFRAGDRLQVGFRRAGLLLKDDQNDEGADASDKGIITFHWSIMQDPHRPLNLSHEYMNVWHERSDYNGNQFTFVGGVVLPGDGGTGVDTPAERKVWKIQNFKNEFIFQTPILFKGTWQNFAVQLDHTNSTIRVFYSTGNEKLKPITSALPNNNTGGGQLQLGIAKKPTETETVVWDGFQEHVRKRGEGQIYGGVFVEDSRGGCVSL